VLLAVLAGNEWGRRANAVRVVQPVLMRLCARYLMFERRGRKTLDQVGNFHIQNGATIARLNFLADTSDKVGGTKRFVKKVASFTSSHLHDAIDTLRRVVVDARRGCGNLVASW